MGVEDLLYGYLGGGFDFIYRDFDRVKIRPLEDDISRVYESVWDPDEIARVLSELNNGDSSHWHVVDHKIEGRNIQTEVLPIKYSEIKFLRDIGKKPRVLSANGIFRTNDSYLIVHKRSDKLHVEPNKIHSYGGSMNIGETIERTVWREFGEEAFSGQLEYHPDRFIPLSFLSTANGYLQALYVVDLPISLEEFERTKNPNWEGDPIIVGDNKEGLYDFLSRDPKDFVMEGYAGLMKYASRYHDGDDTKFVRKIIYEYEDRVEG